MKAKHTPGPWHVQPGRLHLVDDANGQGVADTHNYWRADSTEEREQANARLIAAAPDLLAALTHLLDMMHPHLLDLEGDMGRDLADAMQSARTALAKARGEEGA